MDCSQVFCMTALKNSHHNNKKSFNLSHKISQTTTKTNQRNARPNLQYLSVWHITKKEARKEGRKERQHTMGNSQTKQPPKHIAKFLKEYAPRKEIFCNGVAGDEGTINQKGHCLLIVSSTSGFGNASKLAPMVVRCLSKGFSKITVMPTTHAGHVYEIMSNETSFSSYDLAVILGGDGAFSEAVNGMLQREDGQKVTLAHCPGGSGCSTSGNTIGVWKGTDVEKACEIICQRKFGKMDVIECSKDSQVYYSISCISGGIYTDIVDLADQHYKWTYHIFGPTARYAFGLIHAYWKYGSQDNHRQVKYTIQYEGDNEEEVVTMPTNGFAVYNDGRVTEHSRFANAQVSDGHLSLAVDKQYLGSLRKQLSYVGDLAKEKPWRVNLQRPIGLYVIIVWEFKWNQ